MNKRIKNIVFILLIVIIAFITTSVYAEEVQPFLFCRQEGVLKILHIAGSVKNILKISVPVLLIIMATIDLVKAFISGDDKDMKSAGSSAIKRIIAGVLIFFIPTVVDIVLKRVYSYDPNEYYNENGKGEFGICTLCFAYPNKAFCENMAIKTDKTTDNGKSNESQSGSQDKMRDGNETK